MNIRILNLKLLNFKGVRNLEINFGDVTNITGENGTGKTSIVDAFLWLMFGKNSEDAKDFNIKTLDKHNQPIHRLEHQVSATLEYDGRAIVFRKVYKEKWVKKRGESAEEFTGHETLYFVDDVPVQQKEYQTRVDVLMNENIAKMITSPVYFNSIKWTDRRAILEAMAGTISNEEIAGSNVEFKKFLQQLGNDKFIDFKKRNAAKAKLLRDSLETIPTRISEAEHNKPQPLDWDGIALQIKNKQTEIAAIETAIEDKATAYDLAYRNIQEKQKEKFALESKLQQAKQNAGSAKKNKLFELEGEIAGIEADVKQANRSIESNSATIKSNLARIESLTKRNDTIRAQWNEENSKTLVIDEHVLNCPTCKQLLPEVEQNNIREKLTTNFNSSKQSKLNDIQKEGANNKQEIEKLNTENVTLTQLNDATNQKLIQLKKKLDLIKEDLETVKAWPEQASPEALELQKQIDAFVIPASPVIDNADLKAKKDVLNAEITALNTSLGTKQQIEKVNARIAELEEEQSKQAQELADLERMEFIMDSFSKAKIETIESRINGKFSLVKFKMFERQINGGETECCECMVNGVPYSDVNTAGRINAGIDIINALTEHYKINAPVFIDNRESIIRILPCKSQIINLIAKKGTPLTVEVEELEAVGSN